MLSYYFYDWFCVSPDPVKVGLADQPAEWVYSSARDYSGTKGLIDIDLLTKAQNAVDLVLTIEEEAQADAYASRTSRPVY